MHRKSLLSKCASVTFFSLNSLHRNKVVPQVFLNETNRHEFIQLEVYLDKLTGDALVAHRASVPSNKTKQVQQNLNTAFPSNIFWILIFKDVISSVYYVTLLRSVRSFTSGTPVALSSSSRETYVGCHSFVMDCCRNCQQNTNPNTNLHKKTHSCRIVWAFCKQATVSQTELTQVLPSTTWQAHTRKQIQK